MVYLVSMNTRNLKFPDVPNAPVLIPVLNYLDAARISIERGYTESFFVQSENGAHSFILVSLHEWEQGQVALEAMEKLPLTAVVYRL